MLVMSSHPVALTPTSTTLSRFPTELRRTRTTSTTLGESTVSVFSTLASATISTIPTENRRELKWQMALYVGLIRWVMFINIWIVAMQRIPTDTSRRTRDGMEMLGLSNHSEIYIVITIMVSMSTTIPTGAKDRRSRVVQTMLGKFSIPVSSASTNTLSTVSRVPTEKIQRSPYTDDDGYAWSVRSDGDVVDYYDVGSSYGCIQSPEQNLVAFLIHKTGAMAIPESTNMNIWSSYGSIFQISPDTDYSYRVYYSNPKGDVGYNAYVSNDSYGIT